MATWDLIWIAVFFSSAAILGWTYVGYSMTLKWLARRLPNSPLPGRSKPAPGSVSIVIAARNESARVGAKVSQLLELRSDLVGQIIIVCDHCTDDTAAVVRALGDPRVVAIELQEGPAGAVEIDAPDPAAAFLRAQLKLPEAARRSVPHLAPSFEAGLLKADGQQQDQCLDGVEARR